MEKKTIDLQLIANVFREINCTSLINAERDYQIAQVLDVLILEDTYE